MATENIPPPRSGFLLTSPPPLSNPLEIPIKLHVFQCSGLAESPPTSPGNSNPFC